MRYRPQENQDQQTARGATNSCNVYMYFEVYMYVAAASFCISSSISGRRKASTYGAPSTPPTRCSAPLCSPFPASEHLDLRLCTPSAPHPPQKHRGDDHPSQHQQPVHGFSSICHSQDRIAEPQDVRHVQHLSMGVLWKQTGQRAEHVNKWHGRRRGARLSTAPCIDRLVCCKVCFYSIVDCCGLERVNGVRKRFHREQVIMIMWSRQKRPAIHFTRACIAITNQ